MREHADAGKITAYEGSTLFEALKIVLEGLGSANSTDEEVREIMGRKILEFSADKIYDSGRRDGEEKGRAEGHAEGLANGIQQEKVSGIQRAINKLHMTLDDAMDYMDITVEDQPKYVALLREQELEYSAEGYGRETTP